MTKPLVPMDAIRDFFTSKPVYVYKIAPCYNVKNPNNNCFRNDYPKSG